MDSKKEVYDLIPKEYYPKTILIKPENDITQISKIVRSESIQYPFFIKPDIGLRGFAVKKINDFDSWNEYHQNANFNYLIQEFVSLPNEIGMFYVKNPRSAKGEITGIVSKEFMSIRGDGRTSVRELLKQNPRFEIQLKALEVELGKGMDKIFKKEENITVVPYGNHARGAKFLDSSNLITPRLIETFDAICSKIEGFNFGRLDIMYESIEDLEKGKNFMIIEINGAKSEPTHIYDPRHSVFFAWKELARHISYMNKISIENHMNQGARYLGFWEGLSEIIDHFKHNKKIANFRVKKNNLADNTEKTRVVYQLKTQNR